MKDKELIKILKDVITEIPCYRYTFNPFKEIKTERKHLIYNKEKNSIIYNDKKYKLKDEQRELFILYIQKYFYKYVMIVNQHFEQFQRWFTEEDLDYLIVLHKKFIGINEKRHSYIDKQFNPKLEYNDEDEKKHEELDKQVSALLNKIENFIKNS